MTILISSFALNSTQEKQYQALLKEAETERFFYDIPLNHTKQRQVIIDEESNVIGAFESSRIGYEGRNYYRTNRPYVFEQYRGQGIMTTVLRDWYKERRPALCWIDDENVASIKVFISLGFEQGLRFQAKTKWGHFYILE
jgi:RimJ/RimL family protein N-acetyltransferase